MLLIKAAGLLGSLAATVLVCLVVGLIAELITEPDSLTSRVIWFSAGAFLVSWSIERDWRASAKTLVWGRNLGVLFFALGKELYFIAPDGKLMAASVTVSETFAAGTPVSLFSASLAAGGEIRKQEYAVSRDGRFLINQPVETSTTPPITLILNWHPEANSGWAGSCPGDPYFAREMPNCQMLAAVGLSERSADAAGIVLSPFNARARDPLTCKSTLKCQYERWWNMDIKRFRTKKHFLGYAGRYARRPPIAQHRFRRISRVEVTFSTRDTKSRRMVETRYPMSAFV
jgi:hypothetical protein